MLQFSFAELKQRVGRFTVKKGALARFPIIRFDENLQKPNGRNHAENETAKPLLNG